MTTLIPRNKVKDVGIEWNMTVVEFTRITHLTEDGVEAIMNKMNIVPVRTPSQPYSKMDLFPINKLNSFVDFINELGLAEEGILDNIKQEMKYLTGTWEKPKRRKTTKKKQEPTFTNRPLYGGFMEAKIEKDRAYMEVGRVNANMVYGELVRMANRKAGLPERYYHNYGAFRFIVDQLGAEYVFEKFRLLREKFGNL